MSDDELNRIVRRLDTYKKISDYSEKEKVTAMDKMNKIMKNVGTVSEWSKSISTLVENINKIRKELDGVDSKPKQSQQKPKGKK